MRAADRLKGDFNFHQTTNRHDELCRLADDFLMSEEGKMRAVALDFYSAHDAQNVAPQCAFPVELLYTTWDYAIVQGNAPKQFSLKGFCDISADFRYLVGDQERESRIFVEAKPRLVVGEVIRQLKYYKHHSGKQCVLAVVTFDRADGYILQIRMEDIDVWTFVEDGDNWKLWNY